VAKIMQEFPEDLPTVEEVQDIVENVLLVSPYRITAKAYIIYRDQHARMRQIIDQSNVDAVDQYLRNDDWQVKENSNMTYSLQGLNQYVSSKINSAYWLNKIYTQDIREAHQRGDFHIHDLGSLSVYCVGWDLQDLLTVGFRGAPGKIESKPAKHFRAALGQICNFLYTMQGESAGAVAFSSFDTLLAPYIRYDGLTYGEVKQAMQEFIFNMNVPTRVGFQTPFSNLTLDLTVPSHYQKQPVLIGGQPQKETYGQFQEEMNLLNQAFLEVMTEGDSRGRVFTFPIPTYNITQDFDWENSISPYLWAATAKYGLPYFANFVNSDMKPEDVRSMCCRLRIKTSELEKRGGGLFGANPLTGSIGVVTINMPRLGYLAKNKKDFLARLEKLMILAKDSLETKRKVLENFTEHNLYPYSKFYLRNIKEHLGGYWHNHFSTIGLVGLNEASLNLIDQNIGSTEGQEFALEVLDFIREKLISFQEETGVNYNLEATPAEATTYRLALKDKEYYPEVRCANEADYQKGAAPYYTNSSQLPVDYTDDLFEILELQDKIQCQYTGGTVLHFFLGERISDLSTVPKLIKKICQNYRLPYFTLSPTFSVCPIHGYLSGEQSQCPECGSDCEIYSRIVGYLRPVRNWNEGKAEEFKHRRSIKID
jgi:ribonucleoside-triphosphate reductase (formate)